MQLRITRRFRIRGLLFMGCGLLIAAIALITRLMGDGPGAVATANPSSSVPERVAIGEALDVSILPDIAPAEETKPNPTWEAVVMRAVQADGEDYRSMTAHLAELEAYIAERSNGSQAFAESVLSAENKLRFAWYTTAGAAEGVSNIIKHIAGRDPTDEWGASQIRQFIAQELRIHLIDKEDLRRRIDGAYAGYIADVEAIENRLLIDLGIDVEDIGIKQSLPPLAHVNPTLDARYSEAVDDAVKTAIADMSMTIMQQFLGWLIGDAISGRTVRRNASGLERASMNVATGVAVDKALEVAANKAGYDPSSAMVANLDRGLMSLRVAVFNGDVAAIDLYKQLEDYPRHGLDEKFVQTMQRAMKLVERNENLGLRFMLTKMYHERRDLRLEALAKLKGFNNVRQLDLKWGTIHEPGQPLAGVPLSTLADKLKLAEGVIEHYGRSKQ